ncbi:EboA domain-containing protein [Streptomyces sp. NBC_00879]|uniref:EboA domain-containing protein n=1 Tax=Streptomyces sp. NBC_00879 TaxID=2975855 RepID=UPI00386431FB|nr:EboA domain-containing protein [Streptomyces sp. NBC_00879]
MTPTHKELDEQLPDDARAWLDEALVEAAEAAEAARPAAEAARAAAETPPAAPSPYAAPLWELRFASAGRACGRHYADSVRTLLLVEARADSATLTRLYQQGTAAERRAVLLALHHLLEGPVALPLVEDALRTNDTRLVAAAVGPYAAEHLDPHAWRHAVLKCLFTGVPVDAVADLDSRAAGDDELARMLADYAAERTAAGRAVPPDLNRVLTLTGEQSEEF